jgi:UDP-glucose 4-epimerase
VCVRYGNVLASRGSVVPLFHDQIRHGGPVTITTVEMTRFLLSLDDAVDAIFAALAGAAPGETWVPRAPAARVVDIARALIGDQPIETRVIGIRPGEKVHEIMVSEEEAYRTVRRQRWLAIKPMLPELIGNGAAEEPCLTSEYSSSTEVMTFEQTRQLLTDRYLMLRDVVGERGEILR